MSSLDQKEISGLNEIIAHCERLINARGRSDERSGFYENQLFAVIARENEAGFGLQVNQNGRTVLRVQWFWDGTPPKAEFSPGTWRQDLLRLPAAHA